MQVTITRTPNPINSSSQFTEDVIVVNDGTLPISGVYLKVNNPINATFIQATLTDNPNSIPLPQSVIGGIFEVGPITIPAGAQFAYQRILVSALQGEVGKSVARVTALGSIPIESEVGPTPIVTTPPVNQFTASKVATQSVVGPGNWVTWKVAITNPNLNAHIIDFIDNVPQYVVEREWQAMLPNGANGPNHGQSNPAAPIIAQWLVPAGGTIYLTIRDRVSMDAPIGELVTNDMTITPLNGIPFTVEATYNQVGSVDGGVCIGEDLFCGRTTFSHSAALFNLLGGNNEEVMEILMDIIEKGWSLADFLMLGYPTLVQSGATPIGKE